MLLPEDGLTTLIEQLASLPPADRRAVLRRFTVGERSRIQAMLEARDGEPARSDPSPDPFGSMLTRTIASARTADTPDMTAAGRDALLRAEAAILGQAGSARAELPGARAPSLIDRVAALFRPSRQAR